MAESLAKSSGRPEKDVKRRPRINSTDEVKRLSHMEPGPVKILHHNNMILKEMMEVISDKIKDHNQKDKVKAQWEFVARVLDRLFFILFSCIYIGTSLATSVPVYLDTHK